MNSDLNEALEELLDMEADVPRLLRTRFRKQVVATMLNHYPGETESGALKNQNALIEAYLKAPLTRS